MKQSIQLLVEDKPGVLMRVIGIITAKGINVESLAVKPETNRPGMTHMLVVAEDVEPRLRQRLVNEMNRLIHVLMAVDVSEHFEGGGALLPAEQVFDVYAPASQLLVGSEG